MHFLAESPRIQRLRFEAGVCAEGDALKAAKAFYGDAYKFLEAIGTQKGDRAAGVDVLSFARGALTSKDDNKAVRNWSPETEEAFRQALKNKLK